MRKVTSSLRRGGQLCHHGGRSDSERLAYPEWRNVREAVAKHFHVAVSPDRTP